MGYLPSVSLRWIIRRCRPALQSRSWFYFFRLPLYELLQGSLIFLTVAALAIVSGFVLLELQQSGRSQNFKIAPIQRDICPYFFSSWLLRLDGAFIWIGTTCCIPRWAWFMELDIRRLM